ncbi:hypothetical protein OsJ_21510 [Oryza sativa Japonica Group]|uniref:Uncharacterized protein n=1 Tax=Oryza sativa subsp. japonica TaxID=39947 RepID=A3BC79_ORYSJ|nr:hypothetical protein OsJ_21510 [Oryza sativa Japonica Group]
MAIGRTTLNSAGGAGAPTTTTTPRLPPSHRQASERDTAEEREGETAVRGRRTWRRGDAGAGGVGAVQGSYFVSPADRTYDALGLVKQINVQTAAALAEAREVLAVASGGQSENINYDKENLESPNAKKEPRTTTKLQAKIKLLLSRKSWFVSSKRVAVVFL